MWPWWYWAVQVEKFKVNRVQSLMRVTLYSSRVTFSLKTGFLWLAMAVLELTR